MNMKKRKPKKKIVNYPLDGIKLVNMEDLPPEKQARYKKAAHEQYPTLFPKP